MERHFDLIGLLFVVYGVLLAALAAAFLIVLGPGPTPAEVSAAPTSVWTTVAYRSSAAAVVLLALSVPFVLVGLGLRRRSGWARVSAMVLGALSLLSFPIGTALGAYALWALTRPDASTAFA